MQTREQRVLERLVAGGVYSVEVPVEELEGEISVTAEHLKRAELAIAARRAREGPVNGGTFRFMRGALGLTAQAASALLHVAPETISRWEKGVRAVDHAAWVVVAGRVLREAGHPAGEPLSMPLVPQKGPRIVRLPLGWRRESAEAIIVYAPWSTSEALKAALASLGIQIVRFVEVEHSGEDAMQLAPGLTHEQRVALEELAPVGVPLSRPTSLPRRSGEQSAH